MNSLKRFLSFGLSMALLSGCSSTASNESVETETDTTEEVAEETTETKTYTVGLAQLVDHLSLNTIRDAIEEEFKTLEEEKDIKIEVDYQNAAGQVSNLDTIMADYEAEGVDAIIAIATPTAQAAQNYSASTPVIFSAVSDPVGAALVETLEAPGGNITGTSDEVQVDQIIDLMMELTPQAETVGVLYNAGEANSQSNVARFKEYAEDKGLKVEESTGTDLTTLQQAATVLAEKVDIMFSPNDNTVASGFTTLSRIAMDAGVPYYTGADSMVQDGGFATVGINYEELGKATAIMTVDILEGADPATTEVKVFKDDLNIYINQEVFDYLIENGKTLVELPESIANDEHLIWMNAENADLEAEEAEMM